MPRQTRNAWLALPTVDQYRAVLVFQHVAYDGSVLHQRALFKDTAECEKIFASRTSALSLGAAFLSAPAHPCLTRQRLRRAVGLFDPLARSLMETMCDEPNVVDEASYAQWLWLPEYARNILAAVSERHFKSLPDEALLEACNTSNPRFASHMRRITALELRVFLDVGTIWFRDGSLDTLIEALTGEAKPTPSLH